jgi:hypothetical protein
MKKAGILTFHNPLNYGAILQAFALKKTCDSLGYETHIINYDFNNADTKVSLIDKIKSSNSIKEQGYIILKYILSNKWEKQRENSFYKFRREHLSESKLVTSKEDIENLHYDLYLSGSDQIWNYKITGNKLDPVFFLQFDVKAKKMIYAASSQDPPFPPAVEKKFKEMILTSTSNISIRENKLSDYIYKLVGKKYPQVLDPTLLAGREVMDLIKTPKFDLGEYVLIYQIDSNPDTDVSIQSLKNYFNCGVYSMCTPYFGNSKTRFGNYGPEGFLALLKGAKYLVTNSFHGIALSLIYHKQFYVYDNSGVMSRIDDLLELVSLTNRKIRLVSDIDLNNIIDYSIVDEKLKDSRNKSMDVLKKAIL